MTTARKAWWYSWFSPIKSIALLATAKRIGIQGPVWRYGFADGSVLQVTDATFWKVIK